MIMAANSLRYNDLFSSLISDIKSYNGKDPLLPWLRGIKKMKETLPPRVLKEKLPRFLQKCTKMFESDRRYRNDLRYLRVWLQLMDYVDDPRALLRSMEANGVGIKRSLFYQAYALYYEKNKKFEEAEKMYHLGVQNLAEPVNELQKSFEQFLQRAERHKKKMQQGQEGRIAKRSLSEKDIPFNSSRNEGNSENTCSIEGKPMKMLSEKSQNVKPMVQSKHEVSENPCETTRGNDFSMKELDGCIQSRCTVKQQSTSGRRSNNSRMFSGENTVVVNKFVEDAIVGKSEAKDSCHHGLVDPTINLKEAMNAINNMFKEPLDPAPVKRRSHRSQHKDNHSLSNGFKVFHDEDLDDGIEFSREEKSFPLRHQSMVQSHMPHQEPLKIFTDDKENDEKDDFEQIDHLNPKDGSVSSALHLKAFVFPSPKDLSEMSDELEAQSSPRGNLREDTVVRRFVGCTISDDPEAEDVCHHGLVDPTINLKEAMDDINNMFGKPINFVRAKRPKKQFSSPKKNQDPCGFSILPDDDDLEQQSCQIAPKSSSNAIESDLHEPTVFTKEAMDEINKMFGMPLDF